MELSGRIGRDVERYVPEIALHDPDDRDNRKKIAAGYGSHEPEREPEETCFTRRKEKERSPEESSHSRSSRKRCSCLARTGAQRFIVIRTPRASARILLLAAIPKVLNFRHLSPGITPVPRDALRQPTEPDDHMICKVNIVGAAQSALDPQSGLESLVRMAEDAPKNPAFKCRRNAPGSSACRAG